jgi:hypothetical protein
MGRFADAWNTAMITRARAGERPVRM